MKIIAHRGASKDRPEHTLAAYDLAAKERADGFECDIRLTKDGHLVCVHDRKIDRVSNGNGIVSTKTLAELKELNFGTPDHPQSVLSLHELLDFYQDQRHSQHARQTSDDQGPDLFIETKHPNRSGGLVEYALLHELRAAHLADVGSVHFMSFSPSSLNAMKRHAPAIHRILLHRQRQWLLQPGFGKLNLGGQGTGRLAIVDDYGMSIDKARFTRAYPHAHGPKYIWTADTADEVRWALANGVTWLATNYPGRARSWRDGVGKD